MKRLLMFVLLAVPVMAVPVFGQSVETEVHRVSAEEILKWTRHSTVMGPIDTRERLDIWLRSKDAAVRAFRVTVRYQVRDAVTAETCVTPNHVEHGGICQVRLSDPSARVISITVGRLVEQESSDIPIS